MKLAISTSFFASVLGQAPGGAAQYLYCINGKNSSLFLLLELIYPLVIELQIVIF